MAKPKGPRKIRRYSDEFKAKAVKLSNVPGAQVKDVAEALDIHPYMLSKWRKMFREGDLRDSGEIDIDPKAAAELKRLRQLEKEHAVLKEEHALLKKAIRFCSEQKQKSSTSLSRTGKNTKSR